MKFANYSHKTFQTTH